jgi:hypothetical protein
VLYQMVSGRSPFRAPSALAVLKRVVEETPRPIAEIIPETPAWLCEIIAKLHAKNPDDRYQSARETADVLADCEAQLKAHAKIKDFSCIPRGKPRRSGRWKWAAAAAGLLLPVIALVVSEFAGVTHLLQKQPPTVSVSPKNNPNAEPTTPVATGRFALAFDGKNSQVKIPSLKITEAHPLTVEAWTVVEDGINLNKGLELLANAGGKQGFALGIPPAGFGAYGGEKWDFAIVSNSADDYVQAWEKQPVPRRQLVHLAGIYDGKGEIRFYVDGQLQGRTPAPDIRPSTYANMRLGADHMGENRFLGRMNEVRISKVARYDADFTPAKRWERDADTLALYHFDEGEGAVLNDSSGNGHHGEITGAKWVKADGSPLETKSAPPAVAPFTDADVQRIAALPAAEQIEEVRKELMRRNPGFDGKMEHKIEDGVVMEFRIVTDHVTDIAPIRVFNGLRILECSGTYTDKSNGLLADLTPLAGMNLAGLLDLNLVNTKVNDAGMVCFKDSKNLTALTLGNTPVSDAGLANFKGMRLRELYMDNTGITDLTPLQGMPLEKILLTPKNITRGLDILRDMKSLKTIGIGWNRAWPAAEFWERYDKGEFKK